jgi:hypothetical protein
MQQPHAHHQKTLSISNLKPATTPKVLLDENGNNNTKCTDHSELILNKLPHAFRDLQCVKETITSAKETQAYHTHPHNDGPHNDDNNNKIHPKNKNKIHNTNHLLDKDFQQAFHPPQMRCLALVSHTGMKTTMKSFVLSNKNILKKFRLTGTNSAMTMLKEVFKGDDSVIFGPSCSSGPLGGDAELVALMCAGWEG